MKNLFFILFTINIIAIPACKRTCENVKVGETSLSAETESYLLYKDGDKITFSTLDGEEIAFIVEKTEEVYFICQKVTCDPIDPYKSSFCEYIEAPKMNIFLQSDSTLIGIEASVFAYKPETDLLYDAVRFTLSHVNNSTIASKVTDVKFSNPTFNYDEITDIDNFVEQPTSVQVGERTFENVMVCKDENLALYFQKNTGFVAFTIAKKNYFLK